MWRAAGSGEGNANPVELKIRSRMSSSHVIDCMWSWKKNMTDNSSHLSQPATSDIIGPSSHLTSFDFQPVFDEFNGLSALGDSDLFNTLDVSMLQALSVTLTYRAVCISVFFSSIFALSAQFLLRSSQDPLKKAITNFPAT